MTEPEDPLESLTDCQRAAIEAIVKGKLSHSLVFTLLVGGHEAATLEGLRESGWLESWDTHLGPVWTLTPWGAAARGVGLVESSGRVDEEGIEISRWGAIDRYRPLHRCRRYPRVRGSYPLPRPELVPDPRPEPSQMEEVLADPETDEPFRILGRYVLVDRRMKGKAG